MTDPSSELRLLGFAAQNKTAKDVRRLLYATRRQVLHLNRSTHEESFVRASCLAILSDVSNLILGNSPPETEPRIVSLVGDDVQPVELPDVRSLLWTARSLPDPSAPFVVWMDSLMRRTIATDNWIVPRNLGLDGIESNAEFVDPSHRRDARIAINRTRVTVGSMRAHLVAHAVYGRFIAECLEEPYVQSIRLRDEVESVIAKDAVHLMLDSGWRPGLDADANKPALLDGIERSVWASLGLGSLEPVTIADRPTNTEFRLPWDYLSAPELN